MAGPFQAINMASNALRSFQRALDTTGHNIANVNTPGFSRQRVEFQTNTPLSFYNNGTWQVGQGVGISAIQRIRDGYLDTSMRNALSQEGRFSAASRGLGQIDKIYGEPSDYGIAASLEKFFNAWSGLGSNPSDPSAKENVWSSALALTERVRSTYQSLQELESSTQRMVSATQDEVNRLASEVAQLNKEILRSTSTGGIPNDLMDKRDMAVDRLSQLVNVTKETFPDGQYALYVSGYTLVDSAGARPMTGTFDAASGTYSDGSLTYPLRGGELAGHMTTLSAIRQEMGSLDDLATELKTQINALHRTGVNGAGDTNVDFFEDLALPKAGSALTFSLSAAVAADSNAIANGISGNASDGALALTIGRLRDSAMTDLGNRSFSDFFQASVSRVASQASYFERAAATEGAVRDQIGAQRESVSGVNLDEEMAAMMRYQRSYQAAAKALAIFDQVTEDLLAMVRR